MPTTRSTAMETALLNKLDHLPITPRHKIHLRRFDFSNYPVLCWYRGVSHRGRRYTMQCDVREDGSLDVSFHAAPAAGKARRMPKAKRFPGQIVG